MGFSFFRKRKPQIKVLIFAQGRTGTTVLEDLLQSTGYFKPWGEVLNHKGVHSSEVNNILSSVSKNSLPKNCICRVKLYHLTRDVSPPINPNDFLNTLQEDGWKIIYLSRQNKVEHAISYFTAEHRNIYHTEKDQLEDIQINVNLTQLIGHVHQLIHWEKLEREALSGIDFIEVIYEQHLLKNDVHQNTIDNIVTKLGLPQRKASSKHKKVNKQRLNSLFENFEEVKEALRNENLSHYIE